VDTKADIVSYLLQGWGEAPDDEYNAISRADTPFMDSLKKDKPDRWTLVSAHGKWVGLNESDMGNSEVGKTSCFVHSAVILIVNS
jgi:2,3-bisphosphoglycerate-independent phosphoglycerate mutase